MFAFLLRIIKHNLFYRCGKKFLHITDNLFLTIIIMKIVVTGIRTGIFTDLNIASLLSGRNVLLLFQKKG